MWWWLWHPFATFVTTSRGVKVLQKTAPAHLYPSHPFIGVSGWQQLHSHLFSSQTSASLLFPMPLVINTPHNTSVKLSELWGNLHVLCGMLCGSQVPPALTVLCDSTEEKGVKKGVCVRKSAGVSVKSKSIWTVSHFCCCFGSVG